MDHLQACVVLPVHVIVIILAYAGAIHDKHWHVGTVCKDFNAAFRYLVDYIAIKNGCMNDVVRALQCFPRATRLYVLRGSLDLAAMCPLLTKLRALQLRRVRLPVSVLPGALTSLTALRELRYHHVDDFVAAGFADVLAFMPCLRVVHLTSCGLDHVPSAIQALTGLRDLDLQYNNVTKLPAWFFGMTNLQSLNLSSNYLDNGTGVMLAALPALKNLQMPDR